MKRKPLLAMKRKTLFVLLVSCTLTARAAYLDVVVADQPVGYWRLGDPAGSTNTVNLGSLGSPGNGTIFNNVTFGVPGALPGDTNTAANFDGAQAKIDVPFAPELNTPVFTIEAWAKVASDSTGYRSPLAMRNDFPQKGSIFYATPDNNWQFWTGTGAQVGWDAVGGATADPDVWAHLVGVYDGANKFFYVNGVLVGANQSRFTPNDAKVLRIGASATESAVGDFFFVGDVDEVAVYSKVLSPDRVVAHFTAGFGSAPAADIAPAFALQPTSTNLFKGETATLTTLVTGSLPLKYQWKKNDTDIAGATNLTLTLTNLQAADSGAYTVVVTNGAGSLTSDPATLGVTDASKPVITQQPSSRTVLPGATTTFSVAASGSTTFNYQWQLNGQNLSGATNAALTITNVQTPNLGTYKVTVKNAAGSTDSDPATLQFPPPATKTYTDTVKQDNPVGYWRLGESSGDTAKDEIGANDGAYLNDVTLGVPGAIATDTNTAVKFSSADGQKIDVPWSDVLNPPQFTVEVWARLTGGAGNYRSPLTSRSDGPQRGYIFYAEPGDTWQFWSGKGDTSGWDSIPGPAVNMNKWEYLAATYDGTTKRFYVNGAEVGSSTAAFAVNDESVLRFGGGATEGSGTYFFEGDVDEAAIYSKALTPEQIILHYLAGSAAPKGPVISIARQGAKILVAWDTGSLESAASVSGPYLPVTNATSPYTVITDQKAATFYRLRLTP